MRTFHLASFAPMERLVRPFVPARPVLALERTPPAPVPPVVEEVEVEWGGPTKADFTGQSSGDGFKVEPPLDEENPEEGAVIDFEEIEGERKEEQYRIDIQGQDGAFFMVADIVSMVFKPPPELKRPPDERWRLVLHRPK